LIVDEVGAWQKFDFYILLFCTLLKLFFQPTIMWVIQFDLREMGFTNFFNQEGDFAFFFTCSDVLNICLLRPKQFLVVFHRGPVEDDFLFMKVVLIEKKIVLD